MKLLFVCQRNSSHFAEPYLAYLPHDRQNTHDRRNVRQQLVRTAMDYEVIWFEWANALTASLLGGEHLNAFTIVRIHDWEIRTGIVRNIAWDNVDAVWLINPDAQKDFNQLVDYPADRQILLSNAVDLDEWPLCASGVKHLGIVTANIQPRKRLERAVELMGYLPDDYRLTIRTSPDPHPAAPMAVNQLEALVDTFNRTKGPRIAIEYRSFIESQIISHRHEIHEFWSDKSHAVSVAEHEGFCYGLAEGMACGAAGACLEWEWGQPRTFYSCVESDLEDLAQHIIEQVPGQHWRTQIEPFAAPALAYKLEEIIHNISGVGGVEPRS